ncbi:MAG: PEP-CTERM sorting domain-containing protein, partial [Desulfobacteraceae bacterium]|nr:PEP-CTERM sorting domain-containing protein [Desulfobacteraceae bacterium]
SGLDHALFFETNKGYTISFEDIVGGGDADYEDLVVNFSPSDGTGFASPTPEPGTNFLLGIGMIAMGTFVKRQRSRKMNRLQCVRARVSIQ